MAEENKPVDLQDFGSSSLDDDIAKGARPYPPGMSQEEVENKAILDVPVAIMAVVGKVKMPVRELLGLGRGAVIKLDKKIGESVDVYANGVVIARGEIVILDGESIAVTMTEVMSKSIPG
ncbi:flagellar motor switch protein [Acetobacter malorum DSM 14337]|uniref:Flagellar motor switch protein FliN n=2 Tax=Acetobacter TaxID=434 RepID=A0A1U9LJ66_9PROT|nr:MULTISPECIES: FliM/FliN family flagellar motor switch protein [Acetobacter]AQT06340.1 flagellar motor switch protein FliN [Acetobacter persici]KXV06470.1 flagellar motor switch protein FliN [Acetobacter malorum]GBQ86414.1 flagellar motor switch protein [Acetobacter malorum DSM 14337]